MLPREYRHKISHKATPALLLTYHSQVPHLNGHTIVGISDINALSLTTREFCNSLKSYDTIK